MATSSPKRVSSTLDVLIPILNVAKNSSSIPPAQDAFGYVSALLTMINGSMANKQDYVDLGSTCASVCRVLDRGLNGKRLDELNQSVLEAIQGLTTTVTEIQGRVVKYGKRNAASRFLQMRRDKDRIVSWRQELQIILQVFNTELLINNHTLLLDMRRDGQGGQEDTGGRSPSTQSRITLGELPPPSPKACFGREEVIEKIVGLAENFASVALIGPGGIGKTSVALTVLHHDRIKEWFGDNRWFIRCDQFQASRPNFLSRLSKVIGAGVENPEDLTPLRSFLSSREILIVLDNAESILDPQGADAKGIYDVVKELSEFNNVFIVITSRITTIPPDYRCLGIPTLSMDAARDTLLRIYNRNERPDVIDKILQRLDFHPLSVTLLATVARENDWDNDRLGREWEEHQTGVLRTEHNNSLAAAVELSLASPLFKALGPNAYELLEVIAFYPQGVKESNADWLFPTISDKNTILNKLCILSLTYRTSGYITMLAPLRDHFHPRDPTSSRLLCVTKQRYFDRLSTDPSPEGPGFGNARWIMSEDVNVEHLLDVFTTIDAKSDDIWDVNANFFLHLYWHKPRQTVLRAKTEKLSDDHPSKPACLSRLSLLSQKLGHFSEQKRLLIHALKLNRKRKHRPSVAYTLYNLSVANLALGLRKEGIQQATEALEMYEKLGDVAHQGHCSMALARLLCDDNQLDAAEEVVLRTINRTPEKGQEYQACSSHRSLGNIFRAKHEEEKAIHHYNEALRIASTFDFPQELFWIHHSLAGLFSNREQFDNAHDHIRQAKEYAIHDGYFLGRTAQMHAEIWYRQRRFEEAMLEASRALEVYGKVGAASDMESVRKLIRLIEEGGRT